MQTHRTTIVTLLLVSALLLTALAPAPARAQAIGPAAEPAALQLEQQGDSVQLTWQQEVAAADAGLPALPAVRYGGYALPMQLITVRVDPVQAAAAPTTVVDSAPWRGALPTAPALPAPEPVPGLPAPIRLQAAQVQELPSAPLFTLREGRVRGVAVRVIAFSPIYAEAGQVRRVTALQAQVPGTLLDRSPLTDPAPEVASAILTTPEIAGAADLTPPNLDALGKAVRVTVTNRGFQSIPGTTVAAAGLAVPDVSKLQLQQRGQAIALEIRTAAGAVKKSGALQGDDQLIFYAPHDGDYWNTDDLYWLTVGKGDGLRMASRAVTPGAAPQRTTALESGRWQDYARLRPNPTIAQQLLHDSRYPGPDQDHWFSYQLTGASNQMGITLAPRLPLAAGPARFTPNVTVYKANPAAEIYATATYDLRLESGPANQATHVEELAPPLNWSPDLNLAQAATALTLTVASADAPSLQVLVDSLDWTLPVQLDFGGSGAEFVGVEGAWHYRFQNAPAGARLYDISDPMQPILLSGVAGGFEDTVAAGEVRRYALLDPAAPADPLVAAHSGAAAGLEGGADLIYIGPADFAETMTPLLDLRRSQRHPTAARKLTAAYVDVQSIYDVWGYGYVDPAAIRNYLRYAFNPESGWTIKPLSVVLVGDGTRDPKDFEGFGNPNHVPPYLATYIGDPANNLLVDPFLGQASCERCFVQLDGDDPLFNQTETPNSGFMPDLYIGRLPVENRSELGLLVQKIVTYETEISPANPLRQILLFIADNYLKDDGERDGAGDFAQLSEEIVALAPAGVDVERVYYGPPNPDTLPDVVAAGRHAVYPGWHELDPNTARSRIRSRMNGGAALITYTGHSHQWQWALTQDFQYVPPGASAPVEDTAGYLYDRGETFLLSNRSRPFVAFSMTCLTSQFQKPSSGGSLDEVLLRFGYGGAALTWGSSGYSVVAGHDALQQGFHRALWNGGGDKTLGALIEAGYFRQLTGTNCCFDVQRTFLILGDPMTRNGIRDLADLYVPVAAR